MHYSVIYSVDIPSGVNMRPYVPQHCKVLWQETEGDEHYEYTYLDGRWERGHHRKWVALLTAEQFEEFVEHVGLFPEDVRTLGSLGAPGYGWGWAPAVSFRNDDPDAIQSAYVTPSGTKGDIVRFLLDSGVPEDELPRVLTDDGDQQYLEGFDEQLQAEHDQVWELVRRAVLDKFDCYA